MIKLALLAVLMAGCGGGEGGERIVPCGLLAEPAQCEETCRDIPAVSPSATCTASHGAETKQCMGVFDTDDGRRGCCDVPGGNVDELTESDLVRFFECE